MHIPLSTYRLQFNHRITSYNVCYTKLLRKLFKGEVGNLEVHLLNRLRKMLHAPDQTIAPSELLKEENNYVLVLYGNTVALKLYRKFEEGVNPGVEMLRFLTQNTFYSNVPPFAGEISYKQGSSVYRNNFV